MIKWLKTLVSDKGEVSSKRVVFILIAITSLFFLGFDLHNHGMTDNWVNAFNTLLLFGGGSFVVGSGVEAFKSKKVDENE